jgi:PAS domain S-box-containing protein
MKNSERYRLLSEVFTGMELPFFAVDASYRYIAFNAVHAEVMKAAYGAEIGIGQSILDEYTSEADRAKAKENIDRAFLGGRIVCEDFAGEDSSQRRYFEISHLPIGDERGSVDAVVVVARDLTERKRTEEKLRESEERFRKIFEEGALGMVLTNRDLKFFNVNPAFCRMLGYTVEEMNTKTFLDVTHPAHRHEDQVNMEKLWKEEIPFYRTEKRYVAKNGDICWGSLSTSLIRGSAGDPIYALALIEDITERKRAEEKLGESLSTIRGVFRAAPVGICIMKDRTYKSANEYWCDQFGYPEASLLGKTTRMLYENDAEFDRVGRELLGDLDRKGVSSVETRLRRSDGSFRDVILTAAPIHQEDPSTGTVVIVHDITERKRTEEALRASEYRYRLMAENMADVIWVLDVESRRFTYISPSVQRLRGYTPEEALAQPLEQSLTPDSARKAQALLSEWVPRFLSDPAAPSLLVNEFEQPCKDGSTRFVEVTSTLVRNESGRLEVIGVSRDISERKRAEEEQANLEAQLRQAEKMESIGRLAGGVAHDFNNMLAVIMGHAEFSMQQIDPVAPIYGDLLEIRAAAKRSADLTRQLLAFSRKQTVAPKALNLNATVADSMKMLQRLIGEDIELRLIFADDLWLVNMDPSQIDLILANLCVNARDAISGNGTIVIETANRVRDAACRTGDAECAPGEYVALMVADNGCGMDKETLSHLFEPFFTTKGIGKGTGLGLASVYGAVKQNGGFIHIDSSKGKGTSVTVLLPRFFGKEGAAAGEGARAMQPPRGNETILLVEDEKSVLRLVKNILEGQGYSVLSAEMPGEAIRLAKEHDGEIQLLITDVVMPEMNGRDLGEKLLGYHPRMKLLFMSGYAADVIISQGVLEAGMHFIEKPFTKSTLAAKVREVLDER